MELLFQQCVDSCSIVWSCLEKYFFGALVSPILNAAVVHVATQQAGE
jgi:hypothetical protein